MMNSQEQRRRIAEELAKISGQATAVSNAAQVRLARFPVVEAAPEPIAIIGLSGYFPSCMSAAEFWNALETDRCLLERPPEERLALWSGGSQSLAESLGKTIPAGGFIPNIRGFDPAFFGILPGNAHRIDPRQRLLLMSAYHCLENGGYAPVSLRGQPVAAFVAIEEDEYFQSMLDYGLQPAVSEGLATSMVANRISWFFDFRGPSEVINTMCSGGAVAIHRAVTSLRSGEASMAVVGAANLLLRPEPFLNLQQTGQLSPRGSIRSFGKNANGFLRSDGVATVLLKRLSQAEADHDQIYAVIRHTAVNYNGKGGLSIAAPDIAAHAELIERCYREAGVDPQDIRYIEAQGMGQPVADLAEWHAFNRALSKLANARGIALAPDSCRVGTLKPMTGHMHSASAMGALFKVIHSLRTATIHRILGFSELNPDLDCPGQPCAPARATEPWPASENPRLAGIHSYSAGGNNAHLLIQEYRQVSDIEGHQRPRLPEHVFTLADCWFDRVPRGTVELRHEAAEQVACEAGEPIVRALLSRHLEVPPEQVPLDTPFVNLGFGSMLVAELASELQRHHSIKLEPARFYEFKTPRQFALAVAECAGSSHPTAKSAPPTKLEPCRRGSFEPIAIIGLAGRYPASPTVDDFWSNLRAGRDCISEIPADRWPLAEHFDPNPETAAKNGKCYGRWGGFISGLNEFDPLFFKISPLEAETMNPKERLVLETVWHTLEDAAHTPQSLADSRVGVFFGVTRAGWDSYPGTFSSVANRVSYYCDFHGPSVSIDTMCSSSLVAIHEACQHLQTGGCDVAIAGGVNLYLHPSHFVVLAHGRFLSPDGKCRAFGADANGMVPGEGVGAVMLKPLAQAVNDGDRIYGVIRGSASNHGGNANGYTVPNPAAQRDLVLQALHLASVDARDITYVEAHGTGTTLGDPVEVRGLTEAFRRFTTECGFCRIGSLKSNMGHLEAAAGVASLTKVLMQLRHRELVASLHASMLNPNIDFPATPFTVQQCLESWSPKDAKGRPIPRLASISSFGAGGSNAHLVVEEFTAAEACGEDGGPQVVVLSARNEERLVDLVRRLRAFLIDEPNTSLRGLAYTLQVGRQAMEERLAFVVNSIEELLNRLAAVEEDPKTTEGVYRGRVGNRDSRPVPAPVSVPPAAKGELDLRKLAESWVKGETVDWTALCPGDKPHRIHLPLYPFARVLIPPPALTLEPRSSREAALHPLLQRNTSTLNAQRFASTFDGHEFFLAHHNVQGSKTLSAAAHLEMARAAIEQSMPPRANIRTSGVTLLSQVVFTRPLIVADIATDLHVSVRGNPPGPLNFEIGTGQATTLSQGEVEFSQSSAPAPLPIETARTETDHRYCGDQLYAIYAALGIDYGPGHRGLEWVSVGRAKAVAKLRLPSAVTDTANDYVLHPSMLDAAFQATIAFGLLEAGVKPEPDISDGFSGNGSAAKASPPALKPCLPYAIEQVEVFGACVPSMWAVISRLPGKAASHGVESFDLDLCDDEGTVLVRVRGFSARVLQNAEPPAELPSLIFRIQGWKEKPPEAALETLSAFDHRTVICCGLELPFPSASRTAKAASWIHVPFRGKNLAKDFHDVVLRTASTIQRVLTEKSTADSLIQVIMPAGDVNQGHAGLLGLLRTAQLESPKIHAQLIQIDSSLLNDRIEELVRNDAATPGDQWVRYVAGHRRVATWDDLVPSGHTKPWKTGGVYLITGGLGALGRIFAKEIAGCVSASTLVLLGRSKPGDEANQFLRDLTSRGANAEYRQVDLRQRDAVRECIRDVVRTHGALDGILHTAGVLRDQYLLKKSARDIELVLAPKATGTVNLDEATRDLPLDLFVLFSSGATLGNPGQADYAAANGFLDGFAKYRTELVANGSRRGRTISIAWPYWRDGGMQMNAAAERLMFEHTGLVPMETKAGLDAFYQCLATNQPHVLVLNGVASRVNATLVLERQPDEMAEPIEKPTTVTPTNPVGTNGSTAVDELKTQIVEYLKRLIGETLKIQSKDIHPDRDLYGYGLDSIIALDVNNRLERDFSRLSKTLFFEYATIEELAGYFLEAHKPTVQRMFPSRAVPPAAEMPRRLAVERPAPGSAPSNGFGAPLSDAPTAPPVSLAPEPQQPSVQNTPMGIDELMRAFELEVAYPAPRPPTRLLKSENWPNWQSLFESFAIFHQVDPGFSFSRMLANGSDSCVDAARYLRGQIDLRRVLFHKADLARRARVVDLGCGRAADLVELVRSYPGMIATGLTIDSTEAAFGNQILRRKGLAERIEILIADNTAHQFKPGCDLAYSIQVMHFIQEPARKRSLFKNVATALTDDGLVLMAEFVSLLQKPLRDPALNTTVHSANEWAEILGESGLVLDEVVDLSAGISNFLHDPDLEQNIAGLEPPRQLEIRKYNRQVANLENRWLCYCVMRGSKSTQIPVEERIQRNLQRLTTRIPFRDTQIELDGVGAYASYADLINYLQDCVACPAPGRR
jgi:acyl transferase domain-containing protein/acyl carrier protein/SAM-dependent methyltransferase